MIRKLKRKNQPRRDWGKRVQAERTESKWLGSEWAFWDQDRERSEWLEADEWLGEWQWMRLQKQPKAKVGSLHPFPRAAIINYHKLCGSKQQKFIVLEAKSLTSRCLYTVLSAFLVPSNSCIPWLMVAQVQSPPLSSQCRLSSVPVSSPHVKRTSVTGFSVHPLPGWSCLEISLNYIFTDLYSK